MRFDLFSQEASQILRAYRMGMFPMAESALDQGFSWIFPKQRGQLSIPGLHVPGRLRRRVLQFPYRVTVDTNFSQVIDLCAERAPDRDNTWINRKIRDAFIEFYAQGLAHSVECWDGEILVGGLYGLAIGQVFCGESMVSRAPDASKIALVHLVARLYRAGFAVLDTQFVNDHLAQFGVYEIEAEAYQELLARYGKDPADFLLRGDPLSCNEIALVEHYFATRGLPLRPSEP